MFEPTTVFGHMLKTFLRILESLTNESAFQYCDSCMSLQVG